LSKASRLALAVLVVLVFTLPASAALERELFDWTALPELPLSLLQPFVGSAKGALFIAGGLDTSTDLSNGKIFVLSAGGHEWRPAATLPVAVSHGATVSTDDGIIGIGGEVKSPVDSVWRFQWDGTAGTIGPLPNLPEPLSQLGAAMLGNSIFVVGGIGLDGRPRNALRTLDLAALERGWQELEPIPDSGRVDPLVASIGGYIYVCGGFDSTGERLRGAFRYAPQQGWSPISSVPETVKLGPAVPYGQAHILFLGNDLTAYHTITDTWTHYEALPQTAGVGKATIRDGTIVLVNPSAETSNVYAAAPRPRKGAFTVLDYAVLILYFGMLVGMGVYFARRERTTEIFFLGGRRIPWWAVGLSIFGTSLSAITYLAIPAKAFATDWVFILSNLGILVIAPFVVRYYLPRFREAPITTAYEYLETRFNLAIRIYGSLVFLCFQIGRLAIVLFLPALALSAATGLNIYACILVMGVLTSIYTVMGGIEAVIWTDVLQSIVLVTGALAVIAVVAWNVDGGFAGIVSTGWDAGKFHTFNWTWDATTTAVWVCVFGNALSMAYPSTADQTVVQRYLSTSTEREAAKAVWTNALLTIPVSVLFFGIGTAIWVFYKAHPGLLDPRLNVDAIMPLFVAEQFPQGLSGLLIAGVFAAAMSSLDSSINSMATVVVNDYYRRIRPAITDAHSLRVARGLTLLFGALGTGLALLLAQLNAPSLFDQWLQILGLVGGGLAGIMALGVFTKRGNGTGAIVGAVASAVAVFLVARQTNIHFFLHGAIGFCVSFVVGYLVSTMMSAGTSDSKPDVAHRHREF
jgi:SSS family transporter